MAGLLLLWLCLEGIAPDLAHKHIALFSNNSPTVSWVNKMASQKSQITAQLVRALALCLNIKQSCPLTPVHIPGIENALTDIPLRSFGSVRNGIVLRLTIFSPFLTKKILFPNRPPGHASNSTQT
jgi:hypothetical protein